MQASSDLSRRSLILSLVSASLAVSFSAPGCGGPDSSLHEMTPEEKDAITKRRVGDTSKFVTPGKAKVPKPK